MRRPFLAAAALAGLAFTASSASAQHNRNVIRGSGNGANNTIIARNGPGVPLYAPGAGGAGLVSGYGPEVGPGPHAAGFGGHAPGAFAGYGPGYGGFAPAFGGVNRSVISNSGNGVGNTVVARNGGFGFGGSYPGGGVFPGGVNVNVVANSGNGVGNTVVARNGQPGGLNINIVANSGNGAGNRVIVGNR